MEVLGFVEYESVAIAEDIRGEPAIQSEAAGADDRRKARLNERLSRLEIFSCDRHPL